MTRSVSLALLQRSAKGAGMLSSESRRSSSFPALPPPIVIARRLFLSKYIYSSGYKFPTYHASRLAQTPTTGKDAGNKYIRLGQQREAGQQDLAILGHIILPIELN
jgi:hypothetical protein